MDKQFIKESNKLIAEFMKNELIEGKKYLLPSKYGSIIIYNNLKYYHMYHTNWNWLIPVVEKIEIQSKEFFGEYKDVIINGCKCGIATKHDMISITAKSKIEAVYISCVEYIKWYNSQKEK